MLRIRLSRWLAVAVALIAAGTLVLQASGLTINTASISFPDVTLDGNDQTVDGSTSAWRATALGESDGWNVTVASTAFDGGEVQEVSNDATGGTFTLTFSGQPTAAIDYDATAATVESALEALSNITDVTVTGSGMFSDPWVVVFVDPGSVNVAEMTADDTNMTDGTSTITTTIEGGTTTIAVSNFKISLSNNNIVVFSGDTNKPVSTQTEFASLSGTPLMIASAAVGEGDGIYDLTPDFQLTVPAETYIGSYEATVTITTSVGP